MAERGRAASAVAIAVGTALWFVPTAGQPLTGPIASGLRTAGVVGDGTSDDAAWFVATLVLRWLAVGLLLAFVLTVERQPLSSLGLSRPARKHLIWAASLALPVTAAGMALHMLVTGGTPDGSSETSRIVESLPTVQLAHLIVNAAIVEELFFRGFLIERIIELTGSPLVAAAGSFAVFTGSHVPGSGWAAALTFVAVGAAFLTALYLITRNLYPCILAHGVGNAPLLLSG